jgi:hypothetical protein
MLLVALLVAAAVAVVLLSPRGEGDPPGDRAAAEGTGTPVPEPSAGPLSDARAAELSDLLTGGKEADVRKALVLPSGQPLAPGLAGQLQGLGSISFDVGTFTYLDGRSAEVEGTVANPQPSAGSSARWVFTLLYTDAQWLLVDGRPAT